VKLPWAGPSSRFTALFERLAIDWLRAILRQDVAELLGLSWDEVHAIMECAVGCGLERLQAESVAHIGVDEKSFRKRRRHLTLVNDLDRMRVLYVAEGRRQQSLDGFWPGAERAAAARDSSLRDGRVGPLRGLGAWAFAAE